MDPLIIACAKYLIVIPVVVTGWVAFRMSPEERMRFALLSLISLPVAYALAKLGSHVYFDARPFVVGNFEPLIAHAPDNGFPSDHTLLASALAALVTTVRPRIGATLWIIALVIGASRVAAGVHHPIDIFGSAVIAGAVVAAVYAMLRRRTSTA